MKISVFKTATVIGILAVSASGVFAQQQLQTPSMTLGPVGGTSMQQQQQQAPAEKMESRRIHHEEGEMRWLSQLNLTPEQQERMRNIGVGSKEERTEFRQLMMQKRDGTITPEGETRLQTLRLAQQMRRQEMLKVLTPEQRTQLEQMRRERREKFGEMRGNKEEPKQ